MNTGTKIALISIGSVLGAMILSATALTVIEAIDSASSLKHNSRLRKMTETKFEKSNRLMELQIQHVEHNRFQQITNGE